MLRRSAPFLVALALLGLGYLLHAPGAAHTEDYQRASYRALNYSDIIWLYLRDHLADHPRPYLDYQLEYPPLTGALIYALGYIRDLRLYFAATYALLALCTLVTIAALGRLPGARRWYLAATPGLLLYTGLNWDLIGIAFVALALLAYQHRRDGWGTLALLLAVWLKLFPVVFLVAIVIERVRARHYRAAAAIGGLFALGSVAINLPLAAHDRAAWGYFFTFNAERRPEPSLWTLLPHLTVEQVNGASLALLLLGGLLCVVLALRSTDPVTLPLGAALLLWWLFSNKIYSPQYSLWVYLAIALLGTPALLWRWFVLLDLAYYYASFQILFTATFTSDSTATLTAWQSQYLLQPLVAIRLGLLVLLAGWALLRLWRHTTWPGRMSRESWVVGRERESAVGSRQSAEGVRSP